MGFKSALWGFKSASQADFVSYRGCDRELVPTQVHISACQPTERARQESQAHYRSISALEHIEQYGGMGSVPPRTRYLYMSTRLRHSRTSPGPGLPPGRGDLPGERLLSFGCQFGRPGVEPLMSACTADGGSRGFGNVCLQGLGLRVVG